MVQLEDQLHSRHVTAAPPHTLVLLGKREVDSISVELELEKPVKKLTLGEKTKPRVCMPWGELRWSGRGL